MGVRVRVRVSVSVSQWDSEKRYIGKATHSQTREDEVKYEEF